MRNASVWGNLTNEHSEPMQGAQIRFISDLATLGAIPNAAVSMRTATTWTHRVSGFAGKPWHAYTKYLADNVAAMTYTEFKHRIADKNSESTQESMVFRAEKSYVLPENGPTKAGIEWTRELTNFSGTRRQCWHTYVANKVVGMTWHNFQEAVVTHNPDLIEDSFVFSADKHYCLPQNPYLPEYEVVAVTSANGRYVVRQLPPGTYRLEVVVNGEIKCVRQLTLPVTAPVDLVCIVGVGIQLPIAVVAAADAHNFISVNGTRFMLNGQVFKQFVGVNITGILHYGRSYIDESGNEQLVIEHSAGSDRRRALEEARDIGARVVRVFLPHYSCDNQEIINRLSAVLADLNGIDIYLIPVFINFYHDRGFFPHPKQVVDNTFYAEQGNHRMLVTAFFEAPYCSQYLSLVDDIVSQFREEPRIFAWEIGNELKLDPGASGAAGIEKFVAFNHFVAKRIKQLDPNHMVTTGMKSTQHAFMLDHRDLAERLYTERGADGNRLIDFVTIHSYVDPNEPADETRGFELDAQLAKAINMPLIVEETGVNLNAGDCGAMLEGHMRRWFDISPTSDELGAYGFMEWGFCPQGVADGSNDNCSDRAVIDAVYRQRSQALALV